MTNEAIRTLEQEIEYVNTVKTLYWGSKAESFGYEITKVQNFDPPKGKIFETAPKQKELPMDFAKQIIAWHKAGHSMYPVDVLNLLVETKVIKEEDLKTIVEEFKKEPVEPKLPQTYISE